MNLNKFVGKEVKVTSKKVPLNGREIELLTVDENDSVIQELRNEVGSMKLRILLPDRMGDASFRPDRVTVRIVKVNDVYKITSAQMG